MKRILFVIITAAFAANLSGCSMNNNSDRETNSYVPSVTSTSLNETQNSDEKAYSWLLEPSISVDNIIVFDDSVINPGELVNASYRRFAIFKEDGKYGFIDYEGNKIINAEYSDYFICRCGEVVLFNKETDENGDEKYTKVCSISQSNQIVSKFTEHENNALKYYYDSVMNEVYYVTNDGGNAQKYTGDMAVAVQKADISKNDEDIAQINYISNVFGIYKKGELVAPLEYEGAYAPAYKSAGSTGICLKKDGKWGYFTVNGETLIDFVCDGVSSSFNGSLMDSEMDLHPYLFVGDYVPVSRDGRAGYYNSSGTEVVAVGEFEQARPVYNGRAWVKKDGRWGVINLGELVEDSSIPTPTVTETTTTTAATTSAWTSNTTSTTTTTPTETEPVQETSANEESKTEEQQTEPSQTEEQTEPPQTNPPETQAPETPAPTPQPEPEPQPDDNNGEE